MAQNLQALTESGQTVCIRGCDFAGSTDKQTMFTKVFRKRRGNRKETVLATTALLLVLRLNSQGNHLFSWLLGHSPSIVLLEVVKHQRGAILSVDVANVALRYVTKSLTDSEGNRESTEDMDMADAGANIITSVFRNSDTKEEVLKPLLRSLIKKMLSKIDVSARQIALRQAGTVIGLIIAGVLKWVMEVRHKYTKRKDRAILAINVATAILGIPGHGLDKASGLVGTLASTALEHYWKDPSTGLQRMVHKCITDIYRAPLAQKSCLPPSLDPGLNHLNHDDKADVREWFELIMCWNYFMMISTG